MNKINKMYFQDFFVIIFFTTILMVLLIYILKIVAGIAPNSISVVVIAGTGIIALLFVIASATAVISHLKKNKIQLYEEEIYYITLAKKNKNIL